jgi:hypothetical protein
VRVAAAGEDLERLAVVEERAVGGERGAREVSVDSYLLYL